MHTQGSDKVTRCGISETGAGTTENGKKAEFSLGQWEKDMREICSWGR